MNRTLLSKRFLTGGKKFYGSRMTSHIQTALREWWVGWLLPVCLSW